MSKVTAKIKDKIKGLKSKLAALQHKKVKISVDLTVLKSITPRDLIIRWLPMVTLITLLSGLLYVTQQQYIRMSVNIEVSEIAKDTANVILSGNQPPIGLSPDYTELAQSKQPFMMVFGDNGEPVYSYVAINGEMPKLPQSVFENARNKNGYTEFTWEPVKDFRIAAAVQQYGGETPGYVLAGKPLQATEKIILVLTYNLGLGIAVSMLVTFILSIFLEIMVRKNKK